MRVAWPGLDADKETDGIDKKFSRAVGERRKLQCDGKSKVVARDDPSHI
jgi:hypothetical protein